MITFRPTYPGSPVEQAYLGAVVVGGVHADGKRGAWYCALPSGGMKPLFWNRSDSIEAARAALREQVEGWCLATGVVSVTTASSIPWVRAAIVQRRKTFCLALPGSDEEIAAYVSALDDVLEMIDEALAIRSGEEVEL